MTTDNSELDDYVEKFTTPWDDVLYNLYRETNLTQVYPRMISGQVQGKFLEFICRMMKPNRVLEIGAFTGYSTISIARGLPKYGKLVSIEADEEFEDNLRKHLKEAKVESKVDLLIGDAKTLIPNIQESFDLIFLDADKINYPLYYKLIVDKVKPGGFILADNVLWNGKVLHPEKNDHATHAIMRFNEMVAEDESVEQVLLPIRDGLMMIRKK